MSIEDDIKEAARMFNDDPAIVALDPADFTLIELPDGSKAVVSNKFTQDWEEAKDG